MPYTPTLWIDEVPASTPIKYTVTDDVDGVIASSATIVVATAITAGTSLNATNMNKLETGVVDAHTAAAAAIAKSVGTTLGDLLYATAAGVWARLGIGTAGKQLGISAGIPAWVDGVPGIFTAAGDLVYGTAADTAAVLAKPSSTMRLQMNSSGTPSWVAIKQPVEVPIVAPGTDVDTTSGIAYFYVPSTVNGMNLTRAQAYVETAGITNATTIQVRNLTKYASNDALSTAISIATTAVIGTAGSINTSYDDVSTDDKIKIYVTAQSTTKPRGLWVVLEFTLP